MTDAEIDALCEASKRDDYLLVGSELRGAVSSLRASLARVEGEASMYRRTAARTEERRRAAESAAERRGEALREVERESNAHLGWSGMARWEPETREALHRAFARFGEIAAAALALPSVQPEATPLVATEPGRSGAPAKSAVEDA